MRQKMKKGLTRERAIENVVKQNPAAQSLFARDQSEQQGPPADREKVRRRIVLPPLIAREDARGNFPFTFPPSVLGDS